MTKLGYLVNIELGNPESRAPSVGALFATGLIAALVWTDGVLRSQPTYAATHIQRSLRHPR